ncbi:MAG: PHP domain-containing protein [Deltaproteobacteria bacterium]|nr:PHP domain-containing protein [Deltaproteobacteria bacterium]
MKTRKSILKRNNSRISPRDGANFFVDEHTNSRVAVKHIDTHVHTRFSDGGTTIPQVEEACRRLEIGCLITDHNEIRGSIKLLDRMKVPTIPAMEVGSKEQIELLMYFRSADEAELFFRLHVEPYRLRRLYSFLPVSLDYLIDAAAEYEVLLSMAHPFGPFWKNIEHGKKRRQVIIRTLNRVDCIEVFNGTISIKANRKSQTLCRSAGLIPLAGSDSHTMKNIGSVLVGFNQPVTSDDIYDCINNENISGIYANGIKTNYFSNSLRIALQHSKKIVTGKTFPPGPGEKSHFKDFR